MSFFFPQLSHKQMSVLCHQLAVAEKSGLTLKRAFKLLESGAAELELRRSAGSVVSSLTSGATLSQALHWERSCFPSFFIALVRVGERTGTLERVFRQLETYYDALWKLRQEALKVASYFIALMVLWRMVIPAVAYASSLGDDASDIELIGGICSIVISGALPFIVLAGIFALAQRLPRLKASLLLTAWYVWPFSLWLRRLSFSRFYEAMHLFQFTDISTQSALRAAGESTENPLLIRATATAAAAIREGESVTTGLRLLPEIPARDIEMLSVSETSGRLPETYRTLAQDHYRAAIYTIRNAILVFTAIFIYLFSLLFAWMLVQAVLGFLSQWYVFS